jgi:hypothetical protein
MTQTKPIVFGEKLYLDISQNRYQTKKQSSVNSYSYQKSSLNLTQNQLYKSALYGLSIYNKEELEKLKWFEKEEIKKMHNKTQHVLNILKQEKLVEITNTWFRKLFPKSKVVEELCNNSEVDSSMFNTMSFKDLNISKEDIINRLILKKVLPINFHNL